jgi:hypothetical protein
MEGAKSVQALTNKLLSGETHVKDIPALVGVQDPQREGVHCQWQLLLVCGGGFC